MAISRALGMALLARRPLILEQVRIDIVTSRVSA
jgi:hypothetical protein